MTKFRFGIGRWIRVSDFLGDEIDIFDTTTNKLFEIKSDLVVLVPAMMPRTDTVEFARLLHLTLSGDGFFLEAHPKLRPVDTFVNGIFINGAVPYEQVKEAIDRELTKG